MWARPAPRMRLGQTGCIAFDVHSLPTGSDPPALVLVPGFLAIARSRELGAGNELAGHFKEEL
jgi:hypothetical protein